jgi:K+-sensing histidine kinase KdpD
MKRITEPFFTTKPVGKGTGLGLTTLRDSMQAWQSHLMITSSGGLGTTIKMYLTPADLEDPASVKEKTPAMTAGSNGETILLVENVSDVRSTC